MKILPGSPPPYQEKWMELAVAEASQGVQNGDGGPFGAVIVRNHEVIAQAHNRVLVDQDPTCHAEMEAIRKASRSLGRFDLSDCVIYCSCEPCPMCYGAIAWSRIPVAFFACSSADAARIGFDDQQIYDAIRGMDREKNVKLERQFKPEYLKPMQAWDSIKAKQTY